MWGRRLRFSGTTLTLVPRSVFSWDFRVIEDGEEIARIDRRWFRERASFSLGGETYDVLRTSVLRGAFALERSGTVIARATKPSAFQRVFEVAVGAERYVLKASSPLRRQFLLLRGGIPVGSIGPVSLFRRTAVAQLPVTVPRHVQLFLVFLVLVLWKRSSDAAASGG